MGTSAYKSLIRQHMGISFESELYDSGELETPVILKEDEVAVGEDPDNNMSNIINSIEDETSTIDDTSDAMESLSDAAVTLESIAFTIEEAIEDANGDEGEGLSDVAVNMTDIAVGAVKSSLGIDDDVDYINEPYPEEKNYSNSEIPSVESFKGSRRLKATMEALDGVKDTIKRIWEAIKNAIVRFYHMVTNFIISIFSKTAAVIRRARQISDATANMGKNTDTFKFSGAAKLAVTVDGKATFDGYGKTIEDHLAELKGYGKSNLDQYVVAVKAIFAKLNVHGKSFSDSDESVKALADLVGKAMATLMGPDGSTANLVGGWIVEKPENTGNTLGSFLKAQPYFKRELGSIGDIDKDREYSPLKAADINNICRSIISTLESGMSNRKTQIASLKTMAGDFVANSKDQISDEKILKATKLRIALTWNMRIGAKPWSKVIVQYIQILHTYSSAVLEFCDASIRASKKKES